MSGHPGDGTLLAFLDGELSPEESRLIRAHLAACAGCTGLFGELEARAMVVATAVSGLDVPAPIAAARQAVLRRVALEAPSRSATVMPLRPPAPKAIPGWMRAAAVVVLGVGVAASALPGSPVREWVRGLAPADRSGAPDPVVAEASVAAEDVGVFVAPMDGRVRIELAGLLPGSRVRVEMVEGSSVGVQAMDGTRFETGPGRVHAVVEGDLVRVDLPRTLRGVSLWVNGERYLTGPGGGLEVMGPGAERRGDILFFVVGEGGGSAPGAVPPETP